MFWRPYTSCWFSGLNQAVMLLDALASLDVFGDGSYLTIVGVACPPAALCLATVNLPVMSRLVKSVCVVISFVKGCSAFQLSTQVGVSSSFHIRVQPDTYYFINSLT